MHQELSGMNTPKRQKSSQVLKLADLVSIADIQQFFDYFYNLTGLHTSILDPDNKLLVGVGWQDICAHFHRQHPLMLANCIESDQLVIHRAGKGNYSLHCCKNGLWDAAQPVFIEGQHIATFFCGQFFLDDDSHTRGRFIEQALKYGLDSEAYLLAYEKVPVYSRQTVAILMDLFRLFGKLVVEKGYYNHLLRTEIENGRTIEQALLESENRFQAFMEQLPAFAFLKDQHMRLLYANTHMKNTLGADTWIGKVAGEYLPAYQAERKLEVDQAVLNGETREEIEDDLRDRKGQRLILHTYKFPIRSQDGRTYIGGLSFDISNLKTKEQELILVRQRAEAGEQFRSKFIANISHELRTPMNAIMGFSELLSGAAAEPEKQNAYIQTIRENCRLLQQLVDDILEISEIEAGLSEPSSDSVCLNDVLDELYDVYYHRAAKKNVSLLVGKLLPNHACTIVTDYSKLFKALNNVLSNAVKFTFSGHIKLYYEMLEDKVRFVVEDTGIGIKPDLQEHVYKIFSRLADQTEEYGGTGVGLSTAKSYVAILGGKIWFESELGKGTHFFLEIPRIADHKAEAKAIPTLLVAEDDDTNYLYIKESLCNEGYNLLRAYDGLEAIRLVKEHPEIRLVLMDIRMPALNGINTTFEIKKIRPDLPVIMQTAHAMNESKMKARTAGCQDYLSKPIKKEVLIRTVRYWLKIT